MKNLLLRLIKLNYLIPNFESIPIVQQLIIKDNKEWIKYTSSIKEGVEQKPTEKTEEDEFDSMLDEIKRFLKTR